MAYQYEQWIYDEIHRVAREAIPSDLSIRRATLTEDYGGVDAHFTYLVNKEIKMQVRARFDRPAQAPDEDITFRHTEPAMIALGTYAPLFLITWFKGHHIVAAKLIDVYRMAEQIAPPLAERPIVMNFDERTGFHVVWIWELLKAGALSRIYDGQHWVTPSLGAQQRLNRLLRADGRRHA